MAILAPDDIRMARYRRDPRIVADRVRCFSVSHHAAGNQVIRVVTAHVASDMIGCGVELERRMVAQYPDTCTARSSAMAFNGAIADQVRQRIRFLADASTSDGTPLCEALPDRNCPTPVVY